MPRWWDELSDSELTARLVQRGVVPVIADEMVEQRDDLPHCIGALLGDE